MCHVAEVKCSWHVRIMCHSGSVGAMWVKLGHKQVKIGSSVGHVGYLGHVYESVGHVGSEGHVGHRASKLCKLAIGATGFL